MLLEVMSLFELVVELKTKMVGGWTPHDLILIYPPRSNPPINKINKKLILLKVTPTNIKQDNVK